MFTYEMPPELIAHKAAEPRESARLLQWPQGTLHTYANLPQLLEKGSLLVFNESKVIPARLFGTRKERMTGQGDVACEVLLHRPLHPNLTRWQALAKPGRRLKEGDIITLDGGAEATIEGWHEGFVNLALNLKPEEVEPYLNKHGHTPLPPYIHADDTDATRAAQIRERYQTVFAKTPGSVAAPTASLHFSESLLENLDKAGIQTAKVTLHVGAGTFMNPTPEQIASGKLHSEWCHVPPETVTAIQAAKREGRAVIPVGTTSLRTLESAARGTGAIQQFTGETDIFIQPGYIFNVADKLITNFHLPGSSLLMLVAAFIGEEQLAALYHRAMAEKLRFYSFGDGCLLTRA